MNVKIQGGGTGEYANTGSSFGVMQYLNHENEQRKAENKQIEPFFDSKGENVGFYSMIDELDQNKAKLGRKDAKFFALTISPSEKEQKAMGGTEQEKSQNMKVYTRQFMDEYAQNFNKGLRGDDLLYFAKIHHCRGENEGMHAHVIVSRKSLNNKIRLSPKTNHRKKSGKINGFDRTILFQRAEDRFDIFFDYKRETKETFGYQNTFKNGSIEDISQVVKEERQRPFKTLLEELEKERIKYLQGQNILDKILAREQVQGRQKNKPITEKQRIREVLRKAKDPLGQYIEKLEKGRSRGRGI